MAQIFNGLDIFSWRVISGQQTTFPASPTLISLYGFFSTCQLTTIVCASFFTADEVQLILQHQASLPNNQIISNRFSV